MISVPRGVAKLLNIVTALGAMNWGFQEFFKFNIVTWLAKVTNMPMLGCILYGVIALCGVYTLCENLGFFCCCD